MGPDIQKAQIYLCRVSKREHALRINSRKKFQLRFYTSVEKTITCIQICNIAPKITLPNRVLKNKRIKSNAITLISYYSCSLMELYYVFSCDQWIIIIYNDK